MISLKFLKLFLEGFQSIGDVIELNLENNGVCLIKGINNYDSKVASNGAGKSSLMNALVWCIFGQTPEGIKNEVVNKFYNKGCFVELHLIVDDIHYNIRRSYNHKKYKTGLLILKNGEDISSRLKTDTDKIIKDILHIDIDIFLQMIFLSQGFNNRFAMYTPKVRKELLETLYNINDNLYDFINLNKSKESEYNEKKVLINTSLVQSKTKKEMKIDSIISIKEDIENKKIIIKNIKDEEINISKEDIDKLNFNIEHIQQTIDILKDKKNKFEIKKLEFNNTSNLLNAELTKLQIEKDKFSNNDICPTCGTVLEDYKNNEHVQNRLKEVNNLIFNNEHQLKAININKNEISDKINTLIKKENEKIVISNKYKKQLQESLIEYEKLQKHNERILNLKEIINEQNDKLKKLENEVENHNKEIIDYEKLEQEIIQKIEILSHIIRLANNQFKAYLLEDVVNMLNNILENLSKTLFENEVIKIEGDNKLDIKVGEKYYEQLSGGEKKKTDVAIIIAQRKLAQQMNSISSNILICDEVWDGLDEISFGVVLDLISDEMQDVESTFIISHRDINEIPVDNVITVIKGKDQISKVEII